MIARSWRMPAFVVGNAVALGVWVWRFHPGPAGILGDLRELAVLLRYHFSFLRLASNWGTFGLDVLSLVGLLALADCAGSWLIRLLIGPRRARPGLPGSLLAGSGLAGSAALAAGFTGLLFFPPKPLATGVLVLCAAGWMIRLRSRIRPPDLEGDRLLFVLGAIALVVWVSLLMLPETTWDALTYHLRLPSFFLYRHKLYDVWYSFYSDFPGHGEMLFLVGLGVRGEGLARLIPAAALVILLALTSSLAGRMRLHPALPQALVALAPLTIMVSSRAYTDAVLAAFALLSFLALLAALETRSRGWLVLSGLCMGWTLSCKYTALFALAATLTAFVPLKGRGLRGVGAWSAAAAAAFGPWLVKNWLFRANPVHPMAGGLFGVEAAVPPEATPLFQLADPLGTLWRSLPRRAVALLLDAGGVDGPLPPVIFGVLPWAFLIRLKGPLAACRTYLGVYLAVWIVLCPDVRFLYPAYPIMCLVIGGLVTGVGPIPEWRRPGRIVAAASMVAGLAYSASVASCTFAPWDVFLGLQSPGEKIERGLTPVPFGGYAAKWMNGNLPRDARVLYACHFSSYYVERECLTDFHFGQALVTKLLNRAASPRGIARLLRQRGIGYILDTQSGVPGYTDVPGFFRVPDGRWAVWKDFLTRRSEVVWQTEDITVSRVTPPHAPRLLPNLPVFSVLSFERADALLARGSAAEALAAYRACPPVFRDVGSTWLRIAFACDAAGDDAAAAGAYRKALAAGLDTPRLHRYLADLYVRQGNPAAALRHLDAARRGNPLSADAASAFARASFALGRRAEALAAIDEAVRLRPDVAEYRELAASWRKP